MKKRQENSDGFRTHIAEPRWQQIVSVLVVLAIIGLMVWATHQN